MTQHSHSWAIIPEKQTLMFSHTYTHTKNDMNGHHSFSCNSPKVETIQMSISRGVNREVMKYPYNGTLCYKTKKNVLMHQQLALQSLLERR